MGPIGRSSLMMQDTHSRTKQERISCRSTNTNAPPATSTPKKSRSSLIRRSPSARTAADISNASSPPQPSLSKVEAGTPTATATPNPSPQAKRKPPPPRTMRARPHRTRAPQRPQQQRLRQLHLQAHQRSRQIRNSVRLRNSVQPAWRSRTAGRD